MRGVSHIFIDEALLAVAILSHKYAGKEPKRAVFGPHLKQGSRLLSHRGRGWGKGGGLKRQGRNLGRRGGRGGRRSGESGGTMAAATVGVSVHRCREGGATVAGLLTRVSPECVAVAGGEGLRAGADGAAAAEEAAEMLLVAMGADD